MTTNRSKIPEEVGIPPRKPRKKKKGNTGMGWTPKSIRKRKPRKIEMREAKESEFKDVPFDRWLEKIYSHKKGGKVMVGYKAGGKV